MVDEIETAIEAGNFERALELLEELGRTEPENLAARVDRTALLISLDRAADALPLLEEMAQQNPDEIDILFNLGVACMELENWQLARNWLDQALELAPEQERVEIYYHLAVTVMELDALDECTRILSKWEDLAGPNPEQLNLAGEVAMFRGEPQEAEALWRRALELDRDHEGARGNLSLVQK